MKKAWMETEAEKEIRIALVIEMLWNNYDDTVIRYVSRKLRGLPHGLTEKELKKAVRFLRKEFGYYKTRKIERKKTSFIKKVIKFFI